MSLIDHIPSPAEIAARRARLGVSHAKPISYWHIEDARCKAERQAQIEAEIIRKKAAYEAELARKKAAYEARLERKSKRLAERPEKPSSAVEPSAKPRENVWRSSPDKLRRAIRLIAYIHNVDPVEIVGDTRRKEVVRARWAVFYIATKFTGWSVIEIGRRVGGKDHTTVLYALKKIGRGNSRRTYKARADQ